MCSGVSVKLLVCMMVEVWVVFGVVCLFWLEGDVVWVVLGAGGDCGGLVFGGRGGFFVVVVEELDGVGDDFD